MIPFYSPNATSDFFKLDESESKHAIQVLRLKTGDTVTVLDGLGNRVTAQLISVDKKGCDLQLIQKIVVPPKPYKIHIAIAPTKMNDRMEWFLEKATEIGIEEITPLICDRSERRVVNHERFQKVLISAMKQSMNPWLPILNEQTGFKKFLDVNNPGFIAHCADKEKTPLKNCDLSAPVITVMIGPEGDFSIEEINHALDAGWKGVSLGTSRLRTETAGIVACHTINLMKE